jgi:hypothetical protein
MGLCICINFYVHLQHKIRREKCSDKFGLTTDFYYI